MGWLRRWDKRNAAWAARANDEWAKAPKADGVPVERPGPFMAAYVRYHIGKIVVIGVLFLGAVVVALVRAAFG